MMKTKINFLTWNIHNNINWTFFNTLAALLQKLDVDVLVLLECLTGPTHLLKQYEEVDYPKNGNSLWVRILVKKQSGLKYNKPIIQQNNKLLAVELFYNDEAVFSVYGIHFYSKFGRDSVDHDNLNRVFTTLIREIQQPQFHGHKKSVLVGDFNTLPFEDHLINPVLLNAVNSRDIIRRLKQRKYSQFGALDFYYNPMWNVLGDYNYVENRETVSGTYYWLANNAQKFYWNLIDGVLLHQEIMESLDIASLKILDEFVGYPKHDEIKIQHSDHLPVVFSLIIDKLK